MLQVEDILVDEEIISSFFSCDLKKCRGACCTFPGEFGAPLLDEEVEIIEACLDEVRKYLSPRSKEVLKNEGFHEGLPGKLTTVCIEKKDCVFVYYEGPIALCSLEKAYMEGKIKFRKPISCHLFPIRVRDFGGDFLHYQRIDECKPAIKAGKNEQKRLYEALKDALIRSYGFEWYEVFYKYIKDNYRF